MFFLELLLWSVVFFDLIFFSSGSPLVRAYHVEGPSLCGLSSPARLGHGAFAGNMVRYGLHSGATVALVVLLYAIVVSAQCPPHFFGPDPSTCAPCVHNPDTCGGEGFMLVPCHGATVTDISMCASTATNGTFCPAGFMPLNGTCVPTCEWHGRVCLMILGFIMVRVCRRMGRF